MGIVFTQMPAVRRTPGVYVELNTNVSGRGLVASIETILLIGQRLATGAIAELVLQPVFTVGEANYAFGRGSMLARMVAAAFRANPNANITCLAQDDAGAGVAATSTVTFAGTATAPGAVTLYIAGERVDYAFASGDANTAISAGLAALLTSALQPDLPMTGADALGVVTMTARNKGTLGSAIDVRIEISPGAGISAVVAAGVAGATDPTLQTALDVIASEDFDFIGINLQDATSLNALEDHIDALVNPLVSLGAIGVVALDASLSSATTLADNTNTSGYISIANLVGTETWDPELAAAYCAVLASQSDPALPYNHRELKGVLPPRSTADKHTAAEVESGLLNGVVPLVVGAGEAVRISRAISTYTQNDAGQADDAMLDVTTARTLFALRKQISARLLLKYPQAKNTAGRRAAIRLDILDVMFAMEDLEQLQNVEANAPGVIVQTNGSDVTRVDMQIPSPVVPGLHVLAARLDLTR